MLWVGNATQDKNELEYCQGANLTYKIKKPRNGRVTNAMCTSGYTDSTALDALNIAFENNIYAIKAEE
jgi:hypothetical protein